MIKINFLSEEGPSRAATEPKQPSGPGLPPSRQAAIFLASLLASLAVAGAMYWFWNRQIDRVSQDLATEQREAARLSAIQAENQRYLEQVNEAERRLETVHTLQSKRAGPAALMNALGEVVNRTTGLYLLTANAESGRLVIQGQSDSVDAIADFISVLRRSGNFAEVEFHQFFQDDQEKRVSFKFNLECVYQPPAAVPAQAAGSRAPGSKIVQAAMTPPPSVR